LKIETKRFGTLHIDGEKIIFMPFGMFGFPDKRRFIILRHKENSPFLWYQSVDDPVLAFVIIRPFLFMPEYGVDLDNIAEEMSWQEHKDRNTLDVYVVVNIPKGSAHKMTANLIGPIVINNKTNEAVQILISNSVYSHKFPLVREDGRSERSVPS